MDTKRNQVCGGVCPLGVSIDDGPRHNKPDDLDVLVYVNRRAMYSGGRGLGKIDRDDVSSKAYGHRGYSLPNDELAESRPAPGGAC